MKSKIVGLLAVGLLAGTFAAPAQAAIITGTWNWAVGSYSGSFSFTGLDSTQDYVNSTAAGFSATTNFTVAAGGNAFSFDSPSGTLTIGGLANGLNTVTITLDDWRLKITTFSTAPTFDRFNYNPTVGADVDLKGGTLTRVVPEPGTLALLGLGLLGFGLTRRKAA